MTKNNPISVKRIDKPIILNSSKQNCDRDYLPPPVFPMPSNKYQVVRYRIEGILESVKTKVVKILECNKYSNSFPIGLVFLLTAL